MKRTRDENAAESAPASGSLVLAKGLRVLSHIAYRGGDVGLRELARETKLPIAVTHRLVTALVAQRYLEQDAETGKYRVGVQAFEVGRVYLKSARIENCAPPVLRRVVEKEHLNAFLGVMRDQSVVYLLALQDFGPFNIRVAPGSEVPLTTTAMGRVLLSDLSDSQIEDKLARYAAQRFSAPESPSRDDLMAQLATIRRQGYAVSQDEAFHGVVSVGAPVVDYSGRVVAAISIGRPIHLEKGPSLDRMIRCAKQAAAEISACLGAQRPKASGDRSADD
jgi:DNA-binding IclR family transcriptional regulator